MSRIRLQGDVSGFVSLRAPSVAGNVEVEIPDEPIATESYVGSEIVAANIAGVADAQIAAASITDLSDVDTSGVSDNESLIYNSSLGVWEPGVVTEAAFDTYTEKVHSYGTVTTSTNIDLELGPVQTITIGANVTLTVVGDPVSAGVSRSVLLLVKMDGTGGRLITWSGVDRWFGRQNPSSWTANLEVAVTLVGTSLEVRGFVIEEAV